MSELPLAGKRAVVLAEDVYEDLELWYPYYRLKEAGAEVSIRGTGKPTYHSKHGLPVTPDGVVDDATAEHFHAVVIPGGYSPDRMRRHKPLVEFVRSMNQEGRVVAFICHAGWVPASADILGGRRVTSVASIRDDLVNAGAEWVDEAVVRDGNLISSRRPSDLPEFCRTIISALTTG
jgi:protease I